MQERTIDNALLALRKQGGPQGKIAEALLDMRDVPLPNYMQDQPFGRGKTKHVVLSALQSGPKTYAQLGDAIRQVRPDIPPRAAANRAYQALVRLEDRGLVRREGRVWRQAR